VQRLLGLLVLGMVCTIGLSTTGCKKKEDEKKPKVEGGGQAATVTYEVADKTVTVEQGKSADIKVTRKGEDLKDATLGVENPDDKALTVTGGEFKGDKKTATLHVKAAADAPPKDYTVTIKAGEWTDKVTVTVEKAKAKAKPAAAPEIDVGDKAVTLKQGESKDVTVTRKGEDLKDLALEITSSDDKAVTVKGGKFKGDGKETTVSISAAKDAAAKEYTVTIKAGEQTKTINVKVEKAGKGAMNFRPQRDPYLAVGREELQVAAPSVTRRQTVWFTREF